MAQPENKIIEDFKKYVTQCGGPFSSWHVGIAENPTLGLFMGNKVDKDKDNWIIAFASTHDAAQNIARYFTDQCGALGELGREVPRARGIYAYRKLERTTDFSDTNRIPAVGVS